MGATFIPDALVSSVPFDVPLCYYKMDDGLAIRNVYFYKKRNKYMTKAMEEFLKVSLGKNGAMPVPVPAAERPSERIHFPFLPGGTGDSNSLLAKRNQRWSLSMSLLLSQPLSYFICNM